MPLTSTKEEFLSNPKNKQKLINVLDEFLEKNKFRCLKAKGDADLLIVRTVGNSNSDKDKFVSQLGFCITGCCIRYRINILTYLNLTTRDVEYDDEHRI
jgi:hypothetical protein